MTAETSEPRFERFCLAYPSGTVVMAFYAYDGEVRVSTPLAVVEAVEDSRVSVGIRAGGAPNRGHDYRGRRQRGRRAPVVELASANDLRRPRGWWSGDFRLRSCCAERCDYPDKDPA
jgi:hypothetical protein